MYLKKKGDGIFTDELNNHYQKNNKSNYNINYFFIRKWKI